MSRKKKKKNKFRFILLIFVLLGVVYFFLINNKINISLNDNLLIEVNSDTSVSSIISSSNCKLKDDYKIDTSKVGNKKINVVFLCNNQEVKRDINIKIVDLEDPIISGDKEVSTYIGKNIDLISLVTVVDNSLEDIKVKVNGEYDINKEGKYNLSYEAIDSSGNISTFDFVLNVVVDKNNYTFSTSKGFIGKVIDGVTYIDGILIVNKSYSVPSNYGSSLTNETMDAFNKMNVDAKKEGLNLYISSGYRSYYSQQAIYNNYVSYDGVSNADTYSARAGHSEHQTGLAFDLNSIDDSFTNTPEGKWVHDNCYKYGLILRYPIGKDDITGYMHESWHLRYVGEELASKLYNNGNWVTLEEYYGIDSKYN